MINPLPVLREAPPPVAPLTAGAPVPALERSPVGRVALWLFVLSLFAPPLLFADDPYYLELFAKCAAISILALGIDLIWGYTGLLSLGQGLYFGLGAYAVGFSLKLQQAAARAELPPVAGPDMALPDYME